MHYLNRTRLGLLCLTVSLFGSCMQQATPAGVASQNEATGSEYTVRDVVEVSGTNLDKFEAYRVNPFLEVDASDVADVRIGWQRKIDLAKERNKRRPARTDLGFGIGQRTSDDQTQNNTANDEQNQEDATSLTESQSSSCEEIETEFKELLKQKVEEFFGSKIHSFLDFYCDNLLGQVPYGDEDGDSEDVDNCADDALVSDAALEYSETNNQIEGVDEPDFVKSDGQYLYVIANGKFQIIQAWPPQQMHKVSEIPLAGEANKLFVYGNRAVLFVSGSILNPLADLLGDWTNYYNGYDWKIAGDGRVFDVLIYDITDRQNPKLERKYTFPATFIAARRIDSTVYVVANGLAANLNAIRDMLANYLQETMNFDSCWCYLKSTSCQKPWWLWKPKWEELESMLETGLAELHQQILQMIDDTPIQQLVPTVVEFRYSPEGQITQVDHHACGQVVPMEELFSSLIVLVAGFDIEDANKFDLDTIPGSPTGVYSTKDALYVAQAVHKHPSIPWPEQWQNSVWITNVYKFTLAPSQSALEFTSSGVVKGTLLNQFSMDEYQGYFRIATSDIDAETVEPYSAVTVLEDSDGELTPVGILDYLAAEEEVRAVRFHKDVGFVVTFKQTNFVFQPDPLFVIDLSDPYNPQLLGELEIPGFSTYIHFLDDTHLLTIGYDTEQEGNSAWIQGILLQIFDVTELTNPILLHKEVIGTRGSASDAISNHLAFNYFEPKHALALPVAVCEGDSDLYAPHMTFNGLMVYRVTVEGGFEYLGGIPHLTNPYATGYSCFKWWTESSSHVKRSVFMDDYVYSIALDEIRVAHLDSLENVISVVSLAE